MCVADAANWGNIELAGTNPTYRPLPHRCESHINVPLPTDDRQSCIVLLSGLVLQDSVGVWSGSGAAVATITTLSINLADRSRGLIAPTVVSDVTVRHSSYVRGPPKVQSTVRPQFR